MDSNDEMEEIIEAEQRDQELKEVSRNLINEMSRCSNEERREKIADKQKEENKEDMETQVEQKQNKKDK